MGCGHLSDVNRRGPTPHVLRSWIAAGSKGIDWCFKIYEASTDRKTVEDT